MKRILFALFCVLSFPVIGSHIVGGEFELVHISGERYRLRLIYYFDVRNNQFAGPPETVDPTILAGIFRKKDNSLVRTVTIPFLQKTRVSYTQPACSKGEIVTDKLIYQIEITLSANEYSQPEGYYVSWQRCCRNYTITNILSQPPSPFDPLSPNSAGQTFYLEFPAVVKDGKPFINSTPQLFPPLNDYACPGKPYYADFAGTDLDGDSLVYSLVEPLSTTTTQAYPGVRSAPYPLIKWKAPYSFTNIIGGKPDLKISENGFLTVTPQFQGLFVFAVKCEEFRDGVKLGEVRRDFQMLVVDKCAAAEPPQILGKTLSATNFTYDENMTVTFPNTVKNDQRCIQVQVSDPDASMLRDNYQENITIKAIALNFKKNIDNILPAVKTAVLRNGSTETFTICFEKCPPIENGPFQVGIIVYDDACALPLSDTLRVTVNIQSPENAKPRLWVKNVKTKKFVRSDVDTLLNEGTPKLTWEIAAVDKDKHVMNMFLLGETGFPLSTLGMDFKVKQQVGDTLKAEFSWDPACDVYNFRLKQQFSLRLLVEDLDTCAIKDPDTLDFKLQIRLPNNNFPIIYSTLTPDELTNGIKRKVFEEIDFTVHGHDQGDTLELKMIPKGFTIDSYEDLSFADKLGVTHVQSDFNWDILCKNLELKTKNEFEFLFVVIDNRNKCLFFQSDSLTVKVKLEPPNNQKPVLQITNTNPDLTLSDNEMSLTVGQQISLGLNATDADRLKGMDLVSLDLIDATGSVPPAGYVFAPASGEGAAATTFTWNTDCSIFQNKIYENTYTFRFRAWDDRCLNEKADTVEVNFIIRDIDGSDTEFLPPNIVTVNGDGCNEFFGMEDFDFSESPNPDCSDMTLVKLPKDNCVGHFANIVIYNRWGIKVFESTRRNFRWYPVDMAAGVYFYTLKYSHKEYKGSVTVRN